MTSTSKRCGGASNTAETSYIDNPESKLNTMLNKQDEAWSKIQSKFLNASSDVFTATVDEYDQVIIKLKRKGAREHIWIGSNGKVNRSNLPPTITKALGPTTEEIYEENEKRRVELMDKAKEFEKKDADLKRKEEEVRRRKDMNMDITEKNSALNDLRRKRAYAQSMKENYEKQATNLQEQNDVLEEGMSLRDRVEAIFKKYGFTAFAVLSAVGVTLGVILSNLKSGLSTSGKGVGNGLKAIGKKLGEILPGLIGAIASFIFKTAVEVISFLGKNAWLLVVAVVVYAVEQFKSKNKKK